MSDEECSNVVATSSEPPDEYETEAVAEAMRRSITRCTRCCFRWCEEMRSCFSNIRHYFQFPIGDDSVSRTDIEANNESTTPVPRLRGCKSTCHSGSTTTGSCGSSLGLCGLVNLGHTCFMNSALQCLSSTVPLRKYLTDDFSYHSDEYTSARKENGAVGALAISFSNLLKEMWSEKHSLVKPNELKKLVGSVAERFSGYSQEDAQEFLTYLLQGLHEDLNRPCFSESEITASVPCGQVLSEKEQAELAWKRYLEYNNSKIVELFQGQLKTKLTCGNVECVLSFFNKEISLNFDPFMFLALPLPDEIVTPSSAYERDASEVCHTAHTLHDCLSLMTQETGSAHEGSKWYCEKCESDVDIKRKVDIWKLPKILIVYLKRFRATQKKRYKIEVAVEFPLELDLNPFMGTHEEVQPQYELFAVIDHYGSIHGGHYTATTQRNGNWYRFNDETFQYLDSVKGVVNPYAAYVLFYERRTETQVSKPDVSKEQKNDDLSAFQLQEFV